MIVCMHKKVGGQNVHPVYCGRRARWIVPMIIEEVAGSPCELQVCGVHRRFWQGRGFTVEEIRSASDG